MNSNTPKILFTDAEKETLDSLQRLLLNESWDCYYVSSAREALDFLQSNKVDLVVTDVTLPDMDGVEFVSEIRNRYPKTIRMFLTGFNKQENIIKALEEGYTQHIIPKPWIDQELKEIIRSALRQSTQQKKHSPEFQILINSIPLLPALPESYSNVRSCIVGDEVDIETMAKYINQDVAIASLLLHWANSALFGQRLQVETIKKAIIVLGTDIVENLILSESVNRTIAGKLPEIKGFDFGKFKKHSMATAVISRLLIKSLLPTDFDQHDRAFVAGLLHDMGKLVAATYFPVQFEKAIELAKQRRCPLTETEKEIYATDHAELGGFLAEWWNLPPFIVNVISCHHQPHFTPIEQDVIAAAYVANLLSYQFHFGSNGDTCLRGISDEFREKFYLNEEANEIFRNQTEEIIRALVR
ncbi:MAG: response regulator [Thermodesulfobacteriota bacterium]|nr:response regulator [Thermodesulfobacteriota bacterium]